MQFIAFTLISIKFEEYIVISTERETSEEKS